ncbi:MAG: glycerol kinase GlpK [Planctomycetes bacterium]|nr:glycerol kinase GlpK [Planctomycetota bacterium]
MRAVLAIDQGTTGSTALVLDERLAVRGRGDADFAQHFPEPGHVEHEPDDIWRSVLDAVQQALAQAALPMEAIAALGITNQRETAVVWDRTTGTPVHRAIVWQDRRTTDVCARLAAAGHAESVRSRTGLPLDPYFSATKFAWLLDHGGLRARAERGELAGGTIDSFVLHRLTGGAVHATDATNACRTSLCDLATLQWSDELCALFRVPRALLPAIRPNVGTFGHTRGVPGLRDGIPITGMAGDQQAALFGQGCFAPGTAKCTYGTGAFLLRNTGRAPIPSRHGLVTTLAWDLPGERSYALEGSAFVAGACVQWLRDGLGIIDSSAAIEPLARSVPDSGGVMVVPAFTGLGAPHWRPEARGVITGLSRGTTKAHLARAVLEGIALQNVDILQAMERDAGEPLRELRVDGGAAANDLLVQFQADVLGVPIRRPKNLETTALGAAFLAGLGAGVWSSTADLATLWREQARFTPAMPPDQVATWRARWAAAVAKA